MGRRRALSRARAAPAVVRGSRRLPARTLPVPPGTTPNAIPDPAMPAATCIAVPSPPWLTRTSNPWPSDSSAMRRASPGPLMVRRSTFHPPRPRILRIAVTARASARAAKGLVISSARVISVAPLPEHVQADLPGDGRLQQAPQPARAHRLEARFGAPLGAEPELEARAQKVRQTRL